jgi:ribosomal protein L37AE/L43A
MFVNFGQGKCPLCGDNGKEIEKKVFHCSKCRVSFDGFIIAHSRKLKDYADKYWN